MSLTKEDEQFLERVVEARKGKTCWAAGGLPLMDQAAPGQSLKGHWPPYTDVRKLVDTYGLEGLARVLIHHERPEFRAFGRVLVGYHRLIGLAPDLIRLLGAEQTPLDEKTDLLTTLARTGTGLEEVVSSLEDDAMKVRAVAAYASVADRLAAPFRNLVYSSMDALIKNVDRPRHVRQVAWQTMLSARRGGRFWYGDDEALAMAERLQLPPRQAAGGWVSRLYACVEAQRAAEASHVDFALGRVEPFLTSEDKVARLLAARALLQTGEMPSRAVPVLVRLVPETDEPYPFAGTVWGSVGYHALRALAHRPGQAAFLRDALEALPSGKKAALAGLVGRKASASPEEMLEAAVAFLGPDSEASPKAGAEAAHIVADVLRAELDRRASKQPGNTP